MDTNDLIQLANDTNNVALASFNSGKSHIEKPLLAKIERLESVNSQLLEACKAALNYLQISNNKRETLLAEKLESAIAAAEGGE